MTKIFISTFNLHTWPIPSFSHIVSGSNGNLVSLHHVNILLSGTALIHTLVANGDILATGDEKELNRVHYVWMNVGDVQRGVRVPVHSKNIGRVVPLQTSILNISRSI